MPTQIESSGFSDLRSYIQSAWTHVALVDDTGTEITRIDVPNDSRASWSSGPSSNPLEATITVHGKDSDIPQPVTIVRTESYDSPTDVARKGYDPFKNITIEADEDDVTIMHKINLPQ